MKRTSAGVSRIAKALLPVLVGMPLLCRAQSLSLSASPSSPSYGDQVTLTAGMSGFGSSTCNGNSNQPNTINFYEGNPFNGGTFLGSGSVQGSGNSRFAQIQQTFPVGSHDLWARCFVFVDFNGSGYATSEIGLTVSKRATTTNVTSSPNPSNYQQNVVFTATVSPSGATGNVTFIDNNVTIGAGNLTNGIATFSTSNLAPGTHNVVGTYNSDSNYALSSSASDTQIVLQPSSVSLGTSPNPSGYGQAVTLTANVSPSGASGTVTFFDGGSSIGTGGISGGVASFTTSFLTVGNHALSASYSGDGTHQGSSSNQVTQQVTRPLTSTSLSSSPNPSNVGQSVTLTAGISPSNASGTVTFSDGSSTLGTAGVSNGSASISVSFQGSGSHNLTASYGGDGNYQPSSSNLTQTVNKIPTATSVSASPNPWNSGQSVTFTAGVSPSAASGTVTFFDGGNSIGSAGLSNGNASFSTSSLSPGNHTI